MMITKTLLYNVTYQMYQRSTKVEPDQYCNGFTVVNIGTTVAIVNGTPLAPPTAPARLGEAVAFGGNHNEIFIGRIDLSFPDGEDNGNNVLVTQKIYITDQQDTKQL